REARIGCVNVHVPAHPGNQSSRLAAAGGRHELLAHELGVRRLGGPVVQAQAVGGGHLLDVGAGLRAPLGRGHLLDCCAQRRMRRGAWVEQCTNRVGLGRFALVVLPHKRLVLLRITHPHLGQQHVLIHSVLFCHGTRFLLLVTSPSQKPRLHAKANLKLYSRSAPAVSANGNSLVITGTGGRGSSIRTSDGVPSFCVMCSWITAHKAGAFFDSTFSNCATVFSSLGL